MLNAEKGKLNWYCIDFWQEKLELDIMELKNNISHLIQVHPNVKRFLTQARKHHKNNLFSNQCASKNHQTKNVCHSTSRLF